MARFGIINACFFYVLGILLCSQIGMLVNGQLDVEVTTPAWTLLGGSAQIECSFDFDSIDDVVSVSWNAIDDFSHNDPGTAPNVVYYVRGTGIGGDESHRVTLNLTDFSLMIPDVLLTDERKYFCLADTESEGAGDDNGITRVSDIPQSIAINQIDSDFINGTISLVTCTVDHAKPAAIVTWELEGEPLQNHTQTNITNGNGGYFDCESTLEFMTLWENHNTTLRCTATVPGYMTGVSDIIGLDVKVPPYEDNILIYTEDNDIDGYINVIEGVPNTIFCVAKDTRPSAEFEWFINGTNQTTGIGPPVVAPTAGYDDLFDTTSSLTFTPVREHHEQDLTCRASILIDGAPNAEKSISLKVIGPPDPPQLVSPSAVKEGESSNFKCTASNAYPGGTLIWYVDDDEKRIGGENITNANGRYDIHDSYRFSPLRSDNKGIVKCEVRHETLQGPDFPQDSDEIEVKFCSITTVISQCPPVEVGYIVTLTCTSSSANPASTLEWYEGSMKMPNTHEPITSPSDHEGNSTTLLFTTRTITRDDFNRINFTCCSTNVAATCSRNCSDTCLLDVQYHTENVFISKSIDIPIREDSKESITLTCSADGNPSPFDFTWFKDDIRIEEEAEDILIYDNVTRANAGFYSCVAGNGLLPDGESPQVNITVYYSTNITNKDENTKHVDAGDDVIINCDAIGLPRPEFTWTDPKGHLLPNDDERIYIVGQVLEEDPIRGIKIRSSLTINGVIVDIDNGIYTCTVYNSIGDTDVLAIYLNKPTVPSPVSNLHVEISTSNSITVAWEAGYSGGPGVDQWFVVDYRAYSENGPGEWTKDVIVTEEEFTAVNLLESTTYEIRVFSENDAGQNEDDQRVNGTTNTGLPTGFPTTRPATSTRYTTPSPKRKLSTGAIVGIAVSGIAVIILVILMIIAVRKRQKPSDKDQLNQLTEGDDPDDYHEYHEIDAHTPRHRDTEMQSIPSRDRNNVVSSASKAVVDVSLYEHYLYPRENIKLEEKNRRGSGEYSKVYMTFADGIAGKSSGLTEVAVKALKDDTDEEAKTQFKNELEVMRILMAASDPKRTPNIVRLLGCCIDTDPMYMILEYMENGDLKTYLLNSRLDSAVRKSGRGRYSHMISSNKSLSARQLIIFAQDVARGMAFLAQQKCIHRDLAARNVLLDGNLVCKISDFGLAQQNVSVYQRSDNRRLPIRWMAYESLVDDKHTIESDVWSFGVLLWEIVTLGEIPYPNIKGEDIPKILKKGDRLQKPNHCGDKLYAIMLSCWNEDPSERPTFDTLQVKLSDLANSETGDLSLEDIEIPMYENMIPGKDEKI